MNSTENYKRNKSISELCANKRAWHIARAIMKVEAVGL